MAFANFSLTTAYTAIITALNTQLTAVAKLFKDQTTGDFTDQVRYSSANKRLEYWTGSAWAALDISAATIAQATNALQLGGSAAANYALKVSPTFTGTPLAPTATAGTNTTQIATTAYVVTAISTKANTASPAFTGAPTAPTAAQGTNTTQLATTAFVNTEIAADVGTANNSLVKIALNASGSAPIYACRAWVNFNGTGTVTIQASGNVSSITDHGAGLYTVNFATALQDANYSVSGVVKDTDSTPGSLLTLGLPGPGSAVTTYTSSAVTVAVGYGGTMYDSSIVNVQVFR